MKLTRATIPMCPECGAELDEDQSMWVCGRCGVELFLHHAHWGYYAPDVEGVVNELRILADHGAKEWTGAYLRDLADRLEGKDE